MGSLSTVASEDIMSSKGILKMVKKAETEALQRHGVDNFNLLELNEVLNDVYFSCKPVSADYISRMDLVHSLNNMAKEIYGVSEDIPVLEAYGSFVMDLFSPQSDLDLSINFNNNESMLSRDKKLKILRRFAKRLRSLQGAGHVMNVESIFSARVPIVKFVDRGTRVECDLSVENRDGILKSQLIHIISKIDDRFQKLCILMKSWAKAQDINNTRDHTLSSLAIISLVAFHLQTREPPVLPPFSVLFADGTDPSRVVKRTQRFLNLGQRNDESLGRLFVTLLIKLQSVECFWDKGLCISVLNGHWITKKWIKSVGSINIEDFSDKSQNVSRAVNGEGIKKIYSSIHRSIHCLFDFLDGKIVGFHLKDILFGSRKVVVPPPVPRSVYPQPHDYINEFYGHPPRHHVERIRLEMGKVVESPRVPRAVYPQSYDYRDGFHEYPQHLIHRNEFHDHPPQHLTDGYRAVDAGNWRERESYNGFNGKRMRYDENFIVPETYHDHYHGHLDDDHYSSRVSVHGYDSNGHPWAPRHGSFLVEDHEPRRFNGPRLPFPEPSYHRFRPEPEPEPEPYFDRARRYY